MQPDVTELPLRDIHLPDPISWWPPAPGWWALGLILIVTTTLLAHWWLRRRQHRTTYDAARLELLKIHSAYESHREQQRLIQDLSTLLRRVAMTVDARSHAAGLTGDAWLGYLDTLADATLFDTAHGRAMIEGPYQRTAEFDVNAIIDLCDTWLIRTNRNRKRTAHA